MTTSVKHPQELLEENKRGAAQPVSWQHIGRHDHAVRGSRTMETTPPNVERGQFHGGGR